MTEHPADDPATVHRLILDAAGGARRLTENEFRRVLEHVARAGFDPYARERARGTLAGLVWQGRPLRGTDLLGPAEVHYLRHVVKAREWPPGTTLQDYVDSVRRVILDPGSGVLTCRYQGTPQLTIIRRSAEFQGRFDLQWILVDYRIATGHWVTAYQPRQGLMVLREDAGIDGRWLRRPE